MQFNVKFTKLGNYFFFISNLTEWHFSCPKEYNKLWLKKTGSLTLKEKKSLKKLAKILKKYGFAKEEKVTWLGTPFIISTEKRVWENVKKWVNKKEYKEIKKIFEIFKPRFEKIWSKESSKLSQAKKLLSKRLTSKLRAALSDLSNFYDSKLPEKMTINIYLFAIPRESSRIGGGAALRQKGITLEIRDLKNIQDYLLVVMHEISHSFLEKDSIKKIKKIVMGFRFPSNKLIKERGKIGLISELILCSLIPDGYLAKKYFKIPRKEKLKKFQQGWKSLVEYVTFHLYPLAEKYIDTERSLDRNFIVATVRLTKEFFKRKKATSKLP